jgi:hypothetical protein
MIGDNMNICSKRCPRCGETLPLDRFGTSKRHRDGKNLYCFQCAREKTAIARERERLSKAGENAWRFQPKLKVIKEPLQIINEALESGPVEFYALRALVRKVHGAFTADMLTELLAPEVLDRRVIGVGWRDDKKFYYRRRVA